MIMPYIVQVAIGICMLYFSWSKWDKFKESRPGGVGKEGGGRSDVPFQIGPNDVKWQFTSWQIWVKSLEINGALVEVETLIVLVSSEQDGELLKRELNCSNQD